jgi:acid stress chaperone HdeA
MKNHSLLAVVAVGAAIAAAAMAADIPAKPGATAMMAKTNDTAMPVKTTKAVRPTKMTCEEFLSYDEVTRPQIIFLSEGLQGKGKAKDPVVDVDRINTLIPVVIEDCKDEPKSSFWRKLKARF